MTVGSILRAAFSRAMIRKPDQRIRAAVDRLNTVSEQMITAKPMRLADLVDSLARDRK